MIGRAPLPSLVNAVGDRIGLNYRINRKGATQRYIEETRQSSRLTYDQLKNSYYSLNESRTKKDELSKRARIRTARNPLKLSSKVRKSLYQLSSEEKQQLRFVMFEKIHELWQQYASKVVIEKDLMSIFRMDLHGCKLKCSASKNPTLVGVEGFVVQETRNTFLIIKETNRLVTLPKQESIFEFSIGQNVYRIRGRNLLYTTQTRSKVKYKQQKCLEEI